jgi:hypothetical protein
MDSTPQRLRVHDDELPSIELERRGPHQFFRTRPCIRALKNGGREIRRLLRLAIESKKWPDLLDLTAPVARPAGWRFRLVHHPENGERITQLAAEVTRGTTIGGIAGSALASISIPRQRSLCH